jgi:Zn ribbon nucleic-acid-binding protein
MESTPIRLVTQDELRAGAKRILARRRGALVASWGGFVAAGLATLIVPAGVLFFGVLWLSATMMTGFMVWDAECPRCHSPFHITLMRRDLRTRQCLHCGFDVRKPEEQPPGPTTIERRWR